MIASACPRCDGPLTGPASGGYCPRCAGQLLLDTKVIGDDGGDAPVRPSGLRFSGYELGKELGRGAMGVVYRARQPRLRREVAVKVILASQFAGESARKRFLAEAELAAQLDHPNIVPIYEVGETPDGPFYAMKLVEGGTLAEEMQKSEGRRQKQDAPNRTEPFLHSSFSLLHFCQVARAVHHAHQRGVLHRDLKPGNILIDAQGEPHITDFGLARQMGVESSLTVSGSSLGTPVYMSPEQARGEKVLTVASDVWSLGAMLYHLLAGRPPFEGASALEVLRKVMEEEPGRMTNDDLRVTNGREARRVNRKSKIVNSDLETICLKCLEKVPARRYVSALALAEDLERWLNHEPILARPSTAVERLGKWVRRRPAVAALSAVAALFLLVGAGGIFSQWRRAERNAVAERASNEKAREQLWHSLLGQARAGRLSGQFGRKRAGLEIITAAAAIRPAAELRDEAIAHLALFDLRPDPQPHLLTNGLTFPNFDANLETYVTLQAATGMLHVRRVSDDSELASWTVPEGVGGPGLSPQARYVVLTRKNETFLFDARTGEERVHLSDCFRARVSPDERIVAAMSRSSRIRFYDIATGEVHSQELPVRDTQENYLFWSPDSQLLTINDGDKLEIWDWRQGRRVERLSHDWTLSGAIAWQGECLAYGDTRGGLGLWNTRTRATRRLPRHDAMIYEVLLEGTGRVLASTAPDSTTRFWNTDTGQLLLTTDRGEGIRFSQDGRRFVYRTASGWGLWQVDAPRGYRLVSTRDQVNSPTSMADFSPDGRALLMASLRSGLHWVNLESGNAVKLESGQPRVAWFMPDGKTVLTSGDNQPAMFRPLTLVTNESGEPIARLGPGRVVPGLEARNSDVAVLSDDGRWLGDQLNNRDVTVIDLAGSNSPLRLRSPLAVNRPTFGTEGRWIVTGCKDHGPILWDARTGTQVRVLHSHPGHGRAQFSPDGSRLVTSDPTGVRFYDTANWTVIHQWPADVGSEQGGAVAFTPDSRIVAVTTGKRDLRLADARTGERLATLISPEPRAINSLRFSRDGRQLAVTTSTDAIDVWNVEQIEQELTKLGLPLGAKFSEPGTTPASHLVPGPVTFPPRAPDATRQQIDLSRHFNASLTEKWFDHTPEDSSLGGLPQGLQTLDGVTWDIRAIVQLSGEGLRRSHPWYPRAEKDIQIGQTCRRLHFLTAHVGGEKTLGVEAGRYVFHYADGGNEQARIRIGEEIGDFWHDPKRSVTVLQAHVAWTGQNERARGFGCTLQLFHWTWENPRPDAVVTSLDFISAINAPAPFLLAITAEE